MTTDKNDDDNLHPRKWGLDGRFYDIFMTVIHTRERTLRTYVLSIYCTAIVCAISPLSHQVAIYHRSVVIGLRFLPFYHYFITCLHGCLLLFAYFSHEDTRFTRNNTLNDKGIYVIYTTATRDITHQASERANNIGCAWRGKEKEKERTYTQQ